MLLYSLTACKNEELPSDPLERNFILAGKNRTELEKVIDRYQKNPADSLKLKSAIFLISNIEDNKYYAGDWMDQFDQVFAKSASLDNTPFLKLKDSIESEIGRNGQKKSKQQKDLTTLSSGYLIKNIDQAYDAWQKAPWKSSVSFDAFCNYILPYKSLSEQPEDWRTDLYNRYQHLLLDPDIPKNMEDVCCALVADEKRWFRYTEAFNNYPAAISINNIIKGHRGDCREMSNLAAYSARALGIPVAIDYTPQWGNHNSGHIWNSLIVNDSTSLSFIGAEGTPGDYTSVTRGEGKMAKAYRFSQKIIESGFAARAIRRGISDLPKTIENPRILDVTSLYTETADFTLNINGKNGTPVYLCIFHNGNWRAIDGGFIEENKVSYKQIGRNILYIPMFYNSKKHKPACPPIIVPLDGGPIEVNSNNLEPQSIKIYRKFPFKRQRTKWTLAQYLISARFEGSNTPDFSNPILLHLAPEPMKWYYLNQINGRIDRDHIQYEQLWEQAPIHQTDSFRYVRMKAGDNIPFKLGELEFYTGVDTTLLTGLPIGNLPHPERAFDGVPGYSIIKEDELENDRWLGLDLGNKKTISKIRYLATNDKNEITPNRIYELYYWKDKWISLGSQESNAHYLEFTEAPRGGVYWLNCLNCSTVEERPFTIENNKQVWW